MSVIFGIIYAIFFKLDKISENKVVEEILKTL